MSLYDDASLIMYPSGYKSGKIYSQKPTDGTGDLTFTRASTATRINESLVRETVASGVPRIDYRNGCGQLLLEPQRTNLFLNSATLSTQNVTTTATTYTVSFEGTGTITFSGTYSGSLVGTGTGYANRVSLTFTATAGTLTCTVSGTVSAAQCEVGKYATSYIPTSGSTVTRLQENFNKLGLGLTNSTIFFEFTPTTIIAGLFETYKTVGGRAYFVAINASSFLTFNNVSGGTIGEIGPPITIGEDYKIAIALNSATSQLSIFLNGVKLGTYTTDITTLGDFYSMSGFGYVPQYKSQSIMVFPTNLSDTDAIALTTI